VLGPLEAVGPVGVRAVHGERQRTLLAVLLAARGETVAADSLVELMWGRAVPDNPSAALHSQVSRLRRSLADVFSDGCDLVTRAPGYALTERTDDVDATRFENRVVAARSARIEDAVGLFDEGLSLWRGAAYGEFADVLPAYLEGIRLDELRLAAVEERARALVDLGRSESVVPELEAFVVANPLREAARAVLMRALYATGLHTKALRHYQDYRQRLANELGLEPSAALQRLQAEVLNHSLDVAASPPRPTLATDQLAAADLDALQVRYLRHAGHRIAYATVGTGPALVVAPAWVTSLDVIASGRDPRSSLLAHLAKCTSLTMFDRLGSGLSRSEEVDFSLAASVAELEAVVEHTGPAALLAVSQSGPTVVALAARRPDLVTHLAMFGTFANAFEVFRSEELNQSFVGLARSHWGIGANTLADLYRSSSPSQRRARNAVAQRSAIAGAPAAPLVSASSSASPAS
jgi:DNA-binding SARP family transcriptional activator